MFSIQIMAPETALYEFSPSFLNLQLFRKFILCSAAAAADTVF